LSSNLTSINLRSASGVLHPPGCCQHISRVVASRCLESCHHSICDIYPTGSIITYCDDTIQNL